MNREDKEEKAASRRGQNRPLALAAGAGVAIGSLLAPDAAAQQPHRPDPQVRHVERKPQPAQKDEGIDLGKPIGYEKVKGLGPCCALPLIGAAGLIYAMRRKPQDTIDDLNEGTQRGRDFEWRRNRFERNVDNSQGRE